VDSGREWRGGQNQVRLLCRELARRSDLEVRLLTKRGSELARRARADGVTVDETAWGMGLSPRAFTRLSAVAKEFRPDIIHAHDSHALSLATASRAVLRWLDRDLPESQLVASRRVDFHVSRRGGWRRADHVLAVSEAVKRVLVADGLSPRVISVVPDGIDPDEVRRAAAATFDIRAHLGLPPGALLAVNVAALVDHKDQRTLIRAAAAARAGAPDLHWAIAGDGELRGSLAGEIARLDLTDRVHLLGYVQDADALIREANVFVMSSKEEGFGSVVLHALALGTPVVATQAGGLPEIVPAQWTVPVGDPDALAAKTIHALRHPSPIPLPDQFTARAMAQSVLAVYRSLA
jgi:glycosyltransferase involved in cell wall biosynthesis